MRKFITKARNTAPQVSGYLGAVEDTTRFSELTNAVLSAGIALDPVNPPVGYVEDRTMLAQAMAKYASGGVYCTDSGAANAYVLKLTGNFVAPKALFTGLRVFFYPGATSTGASTANAFSLGIKKIFRHTGAAVSPGDIAANRLAEMVYDETLDGGAGAFKLTPWSIPPQILAPSAVAQSGEGVVVDGSYHVSLNFPGLNSKLPLGADIFPFWSVSGNHHRVISLTNLIALVAAGLGTVKLSDVAPIMKIEEHRPSNTVRALFVNKNNNQAAGWMVRPLDTVTVNEISGAYLSGNTIVLPPGTYRAEWCAAMTAVGTHFTRLFDISAQRSLGTGSFSDSHTKLFDLAPNNSTASFGTAPFTITGTPHAIQLQHYFAAAGNGLYGGIFPFDIGAGNYFVDAWLSIIKEG